MRSSEASDSCTFLHATLHVCQFNEIESRAMRQRLWTSNYRGIRLRQVAFSGYPRTMIPYCTVVAPSIEELHQNVRQLRPSLP